MRFEHRIDAPGLTLVDTADRLRAPGGPLGARASARARRKEESIVERVEHVESQGQNRSARRSERRIARKGAVVTSVVPMLAVAIGLIGLGCSDEGGSSQPEKRPMSNATPPPTPKVPKKLPEAPKEPAVDTRTPEQLIADGRAVYNANCIACHALDPTVDGALGPAVSGSSLELLEARVLRGEYPEGHEPKRPSRVMVPLPHLEPKLPELAAYLQSL